ncbi:MAG: hypothetical protein ACXWJ2_08370, partial [Hyphomicrobium sp.]
MISAAMSLTVHNHVDKDSMLHPIRPSPPSRYSRSREGSLTLNVVRLREMLRLVARVKSASEGDLNVEWLKPFMA